MLSFLIEKEFKQLARNKIIPRMLVALPLMAMLVFPWAANLEIKNVRVDVVDNDHSPLSQRLVAEIGGSAYFNISGTSDSYPDALRKVDSDEADMIFVVPQNFEKDLVNGQGTQVQIAANSVNGHQRHARFVLYGVNDLRINGSAGIFRKGEGHFLRAGYSFILGEPALQVQPVA